MYFVGMLDLKGCPSKFLRIRSFEIEFESNFSSSNIIVLKVHTEYNTFLIGKNFEN